jgi:mono/diheme cytochrome c family protein
MMKNLRRLRGVSLALLLTALAACAATSEPPRPAPVGADAASIMRGHQLAQRYCSRCHAIGTTGESRHPLAPPFRTLSRNYPVSDLSEAFAEGIRVGHRDMPEFRLEPPAIEDLLSYLQSIQERGRG